MPMVADLLAKKLWDVLAPKNAKTGARDPVPSKAMKGYAAGIVKMLKAGTVAHAAGSVTAAAAPPGGPITGGEANAGKILGLVPAIMVKEITKSSSSKLAPQATLEATAIAAYFMGSGLINFPTNGIKGNSTATSNSPGPLTGLACNGGKVAGITGSGLAAAVQGSMAFSGPKKNGFYTTLVDYVKQSAEASYAAGAVVGTCTSSGQLTLGAGAGGKIS